MTSLLVELKRRGVFGALGIYALGAWALVEVSDVVLPRLGLPDWTVTAVIVAALVGFPIVFLLAWVFDLTTRGLRREESVPETEHRPRSPRAKRRAAIWTVAAGLLLLGVAAGVRVVSTPAEEGPSISSSSIAVLPFRFSGSEDHEYLAEGIVDLLSTMLDGVGGLSAVDPHAIFGLLSRLENGSGVSPAGARELAGRLGAGRHILGSITEVGGQIRIQATLYGRDGQALASGNATAGDEQQLLDAVDVVARQLLASRLRDPDAALPGIAALTTVSVPALRAYLNGERLLRRGDGPAAAESFEIAIREDSIFALAYYGLALAREWGAGGSVEEASARARELREALPLQQRELLDAAYSYRTGDHVAAEAAYRQILVRTPNDVEAWYGLGEVLFHYAPLSGRLPQEARDAFEAVTRLQPDHVPALYHLTTIAAAERDGGRLDSITERVAALGSPYAFDLRVQQVLYHGDPAEVDAILMQMATPERAAAPPYGLIAFRTRSLPALERLTTLLRSSDQPEYVRQVAAMFQGVGRYARGRITDPPQDLGEGRLRLLRLALRAYALALPFVPADHGDLEELRALLMQHEANPGALDSPRLPGKLTVPYLLGLLSARLGDEQGALARAETLEAVETEPHLGTHATDLAMEIRGYNEYLRGRPDSALAAFEAMPMRPGAFGFQFMPWGGLGIARLLRAQLLAEENRHEEAIRWFEAADEGSYAGTLNTAPAHLGLAELYDRLGDHAAAARHYQEVLEVWGGADPAFRAPIERARQRLETIVGRGG